MVGVEDLIARAVANPRMALELLDRLDCESSLLDFIKQGWASLEPGAKFVHGWAVGAICEHLEAVSRGEIRRLVINVPPGCTKSMTTNVFWPAWEWGPLNKPSTRYISASYVSDLTVRDNLRCRDLILSEWYQRLWGDRFGLKGDQNAKVLYENTKAGWRFASSVGAGITGRRADRIIVDDPHSVQKVESDVDRESALRWFSETLPTRLNNLDESAIVVIMQRVHERDISGHILEKELGYELLCLPMEYEPDHPHPSTRFRDPRTRLGELLWPERFSAAAVDELKETFRSWGGSYAEAGQLQQRPAPRGGGMFQREDFKFLDSAPSDSEVYSRVRGWDLAATEDGGGAFTACARIAKMRDGRFVIEDVRRERASPHRVYELMKGCADSDGPLVVQDFPQDPGQAGKSQRSYIIGMLAGHDARSSPESGSKEDRARPLAAQAEGGNLWLVRGSWNDQFVAEACLFPNGRYKDQVDAASRAFGRLVARRQKTLTGAPQVVKG